MLVNTVFYLLTSTTIMSSRQESPLGLDSIASQTSAAPSSTVLPNVFNRLMQNTGLPGIQRDRCHRPPLKYNHNYDLYKPPPEGQPKGYSPYVYGEPLYDDRPVLVARLLPNHAVAGPSTRPRTQWVWHLGYTLVNTQRNNKNKYWACKLCKSFYLDFDTY
jgi:hypothetical protein